MAKRSRAKMKTRLTFGLSIDMPTGSNISKMREHIKLALKEYQETYPGEDFNTIDMDGVRLHLLNKETSYA